MEGFKEEEEWEDEEEQQEKFKDGEEWEDQIVDIIDRDDKDKLVQMINAQLDDKPKIVPFDPVLEGIISFRAQACATALFDGETGQEVDITSPINDEGLSLLHCAAASFWPWFVQLLLQRNAPTNFRCDCVGKEKDLMNPLNAALHCLGTCGFLTHTTTGRKPSVFKILIRLCLPQHSNALKTIRLLVQSTNQIEEETFYYATQGRLVELAALLLVAREKVMSSSFFQKLSPSCFPSCQTTDYSLSASMTLRNFVVYELASLAAVQVKPICDTESNNSSSICKEQEGLLTSVLLLLEVFERAGEAIEAYLALKQNDGLKQHDEQEVANEVAWQLQKAGFTLQHDDIDLRFPYRCISDAAQGERQILDAFLPQISKTHLNHTQTEHILLCQQPHGQKGENELHNQSACYVKENNNVANSSTTAVPYAIWRMASAKHLHKSTKILLEAVNAPKVGLTCLSSDGVLHRALESLRLLSHHQCLRKWTSKNSIFELLCILCWPELSETLKTIRSIACFTMEIGMICCHCIKEGKLIELAALLMVAREKLVVGIASQNESDRTSGGRMVRQFIMHEIQILIDEEIRSLKGGSTDKSTQKLKDEKALMLSALQLLEVFEKNGSVIDQYLQSKRYSEITKEELAEDMAWLLKKRGFSLKQTDAFLDDQTCFSNNVGNERSERLNTQRNIVGSCLYTFSAAEGKISVTGATVTHKFSRMPCQYIFPSFFSAPLSFHTFPNSQAGSYLCPSWFRGIKTIQSTKNFQSPLSPFSSHQKWASILLAMRRGLKSM